MMVVSKAEPWVVSKAVLRAGGRVGRSVAMKVVVKADMLVAQTVVPKVAKLVVELAALTVGKWACGWVGMLVDGWVDEMVELWARATVVTTAVPTVGRSVVQ